MTELLDSKLDSAGRVPSDDLEVARALHALAADRAQRAEPRRRRILIPALSIGVAFGLLGTGAAVASQWGPWTYVADPDVVVTRDWVDVNGTDLGTCESHLATNDLSPEAQTAARDFLSSLDVDSMKPDAEYVATLTVAVGRPEDLGRLIAGADVADFDINHTGPTWTGFSDARILQAGLMQTVFTSLGTELGDAWPNLTDELSANIETQCSTDPAGSDTP